ncbi:MAG: MFS transporter [Firmicutes bacterium HGW-Firmicutes-16]|nr:MAG: MFS transporter [Firmicutes bacterium HGW-Firmicutes-16]
MTCSCHHKGASIMEKLTKRLWASFLLLGLMGQFAWTIENMYFNVFLYNTISTDPSFIAAMVAASAIVATLSTLFIGSLSDRVGKRKVFICGGYIIWGLSTMAFGLINVQHAAAWFPALNAVSTAAMMVVIMDCIMTFFGSTANDAAFNAYVTDVTNDKIRGKVESVLAVLPLISMLIIFGGFDAMTKQGHWNQFFGIFGCLVTLTGLASIFLLKDSHVAAKKEPFFKNLVAGFRPSVIRGNPALYLTLSAFALFSCAVQIFFPYLIIYMQNYLLIENYAIVLGIVLLLASLISVIGGRFIDRIGKLNFVLPAAAVMFIGLLGMFFVRGAALVIVTGTVMMGGYMLVTAALSASIRDFTPKDSVGEFQGIRMIFAVMLPMIIGPSIGAAVIKNSGNTYTDLGVVKSVPTPAIFLASAAALLLIFIPIILLKRRSKNENSLGR